MECDEIEKAALAVARARLARLAEHVGCEVRFCRVEECWDGRLAEVDEEAVLIVIEKHGAGTLIPFSPDEFDLTVYKCPGGMMRPDSTVKPASDTRWHHIVPLLAVATSLGLWLGLAVNGPIASRLLPLLGWVY